MRLKENKTVTNHGQGEDSMGSENGGMNRMEKQKDGVVSNREDGK